jgi:hypothetical protein
VHSSGGQVQRGAITKPELAGGRGLFDLADDTMVALLPLALKSEVSLTT